MLLFCIMPDWIDLSLFFNHIKTSLRQALMMASFNIFKMYMPGARLRPTCFVLTTACQELGKIPQDHITNQTNGSVSDSPTKKRLLDSGLFCHQNVSALDLLSIALFQFTLKNK